MEHTAFGHSEELVVGCFQPPWLTESASVSSVRFFRELSYSLKYIHISLLHPLPRTVCVRRVSGLNSLSIYQRTPDLSPSEYRLRSIRLHQEQPEGNQI